MNTIDLTPIINAAIVLLAGIITAFVLPWVKAYVLPWIEANTTEKQRNVLQGLYKTAVYAAEQIYGSGYGQDKLEYAKNYIRDKGYTVDYDMIEATVKEYFGHPYWQDEKTEEESEEDEEPQTPLM